MMQKHDWERETLDLLERSEPTAEDDGIPHKWVSEWLKVIEGKRPELLKAVYRHAAREIVREVRAATDGGLHRSKPEKPKPKG